MSGSIRNLQAFRDQDVFQLLKAPIPVEQVVLASYTFLPYVRSGVAATLKEPFSTNLPWRAQIDATIPVITDDGTTPATVHLSVRGPGDVRSFDTRQIIRTYPPHDKHDAETEYLAHVEFDRPDLPWMFTPAGPDANGRLMPWIALVVVPQTSAPQPGKSGGLAVLDVDRGLLPSVQETWAWAHAQVMGTQAGNPSIGDRLVEVNTRLHLSRLLCPLHLQPDTAYVACVVPTFAAGRQAGLGLPVTTNQLDFAWTDADQRVQLPVYYQWRFSTSDFGNFEELAHHILPVSAPPGVGRRRTDTSRPGGGVDDLGDADSGREQVILGPLYSINDPQPGDYPSEVEQRWPATTTDQLAALRESADVQLRAPAADVVAEPQIGPPLYASNHAARFRVDASAPAWFADLNLQARNRVVAGLGTRVVQMDQEPLMASAWNQVGAIEKANLALRLAQFARYAAASIHRRHLQPLSQGALLAMTGRMHTRVLADVGVTVRARLAASALPVAATVGQFRRMTRLRGPVLRFNRDLASASSLVADAAGVTHDWQRKYTPPDGVTGISPVGLSFIDEAAARQALGATDTTADLADTLAQRSNALSSIPSLPDSLTPTAAQSVRPVLEDLAAGDAAAVLEALLAATPRLDEMAHDRNLATVGAGKALLIQNFVHTEAPFRHNWSVDRAIVQRLGLPVNAEIGPSDVNDQTLMDFANQLVNVALQYGVNTDLDLLLERSLVEPLRRYLTSLNQLRESAIAEGLTELSTTMLAPDTPAVAVRSPINVPDLDLLTKLDPGRTVTNRITGRLAATAVLPGWLRPGWFDDQRVEPVMAAPTFPFAMYEALYRYDKNWLIPGLGRIQRNEMVTLLTTNNVFVEAFLIGLNHEMARTLLWRGYPTDQRGTYFRSFWTTNDELLQPLHAFTDVPLGQHMDPRLQGRVVLLVRGELVHRYPGLLAHLHQEANRTPDGIPVFMATPPAPVLFRIFIEPTMLLVGFDVSAGQVKHPDQWFTLSENPTEPRFGLSDNDGQPTDLSSRDDLAWADFDTANGAFLRAAQPVLPVVDSARWGTHSAAAAHLLFQLPARAAYAAQTMIEGAGG